MGIYALVNHSACIYVRGGVSKAACRGVAQSGSASGLGPEGRRFESCLPDHF